MHEGTCEGKDGAVRAASGQEVGHVAPPGVHKDGRSPQGICHHRRACTQLLAHPAICIRGQVGQHYLPILLLSALSQVLV